MICYKTKLTIKRIELSKANVRFFIDSTGTINLDKIIKSIAKPTPDSLKTEPKIKFQLQNVEINQSRFRLIRQNAKKSRSVLITTKLTFRIYLSMPAILILSTQPVLKYISLAAPINQAYILINSNAP